MKETKLAFALALVAVCSTGAVAQHSASALLLLAENNTAQNPRRWLQ